MASALLRHDRPRCSRSLQRQAGPGPQGCRVNTLAYEWAKAQLRQLQICFHTRCDEDSSRPWSFWNTATFPALQGARDARRSQWVLEDRPGRGRERRKLCQPEAMKHASE